MHLIIVPGLALAGIVLFTMPSPETNTKNPSSVMAAQRRLFVLGYDPGPVDGILGGKTRAAIAAWLDWTGEPDGDLLPRPLLVIDQIAP